MYLGVEDRVVKATTPSKGPIIETSIREGSDEKNYYL